MSVSSGKETGRTASHLIVLVAVCGAIISSSTMARAAGYDRTGPWWGKVKRPLLGIAYTAEPSDYNNTNVCNNPSACKYFDSDFANGDFSLLWGSSGRDDLDAIRKLKMNFITLYDWVGGFCRDHKPFLDAAWNSGDKSLMVTIPISNFNVQDVFNPTTTTNIRSILFQAYGLDRNGNGTPQIHPAVVMWRIGNEVQRNQIPLQNVAQVVKIIVDFEKEKSVPDNQKLVFTSDVDFEVLGGALPGISQLLALQQAFTKAGLSDVWYFRFIASMNTTNSGSFIDDYVKNVFPRQGDFNQGSGLALFFSEYGQNSKDACAFEQKNGHSHLNCNNLSDQNKAQEIYDRDEFNVATALAKSSSDSGTGYFYGFAVFQWQDAFWKCPGEACTESLFGIQTVGPKVMDGSISGGNCGLASTTYPVNKFDRKPVYLIIPDSLARTHKALLRKK